MIPRFENHPSVCVQGVFNAPSPLKILGMMGHSQGLKIVKETKIGNFVLTLQNMDDFCSFYQ